jgi:signal transduction histidine kinase
VSPTDGLEEALRRPSVLIVSDDTEFVRRVMARWQTERSVPDITLVTSDMLHPARASSYDLTIVGFIAHSQAPAVLSSLCCVPGKPVIFLAEEGSRIQPQAGHSHLLTIAAKDEWASTLVLLAGEALRRVEALARAHRAERMALESQNHATLGRYMLDMRPSINNALTSVLGNADLLLLEPGQAIEDTREQIRTIHTMALRLNEIMQRFSSLASEMRAGEKESQDERPSAMHDLAGKS